MKSHFLYNDMLNENDVINFQLHRTSSYLMIISGIGSDDITQNSTLLGIIATGERGKNSQLSWVSRQPSSGISVVLNSLNLSISAGAGNWLIVSILKL